MANKFGNITRDEKKELKKQIIIFNERCLSLLSKLFVRPIRDSYTIMQCRFFSNKVPKILEACGKEEPISWTEINKSLVELELNAPYAGPFPWEQQPIEDKENTSYAWPFPWDYPIEENAPYTGALPRQPYKN